MLCKPDFMNTKKPSLGSATKRQLELLIRENKDAKISEIGELLGASQDSSSQNKNQKYKYFLKALVKALDELEVIAEYLGVSTENILFPNGIKRKQSNDFESRTLYILERIAEKCETRT